MKYLLLLIALSAPAHAAEKALFLNDHEQSAYRAILDMACRTQGLSTMCRNAIILSDKLDQAGVITEQKAAPLESQKDGDQ